MSNIGGIWIKASWGRATIAGLGRRVLKVVRIVSALCWLLSLINAKVAISGREYLLKRITAAVPTRGPVTVELMPL